MPDRVFIPSRLRDNPYLDFQSYAASLAELDPVERARLLEGDWDVRAKGSMFDRLDMPIVDDYPRAAKLCRYWDLASTKEDSKKAADPDWTAGGLVGLHDGQTWLIDMVRFRDDPGGVDRRLKSTAESDTRAVPVVMEREPGASGKIAVHHFRRRVFVGWSYYDEPKRQDKPTAARPLSVASKNGNVFVVRGDWNDVWFDEAEVFPQPGFHDDQVDAFSGAFNWLSGAGRPAGGGLSN